MRLRPRTLQYLNSLKSSSQQRSLKNDWKIKENPGEGGIVEASYTKYYPKKEEIICVNCCENQMKSEISTSSQGLFMVNCD